MTRKDALHMALKALRDKDAQEKILEIIGDLPLTNWSEAAIHDSIEQFIADNGRVPTASDFKRRGLPPHPVIKLRFGITLREFLDKHYPIERKCDSHIYYKKDKNEWKAAFIEIYTKVKPCSANEYNTYRSAGTPTWGSIARLFGIKRWLDWIGFCGVDRYKGERKLTWCDSPLNIISRPDINIPRG